MDTKCFSVLNKSYSFNLIAFKKAKKTSGSEKECSCVVFSCVVKWDTEGQSLHTRTNTGMHAYTCATRSPNHPCLRHRLVCRPQNIHEECCSPHKHKLHLDLYSAFSPRARICTHTESPVYLSPAQSSLLSTFV